MCKPGRPIKDLGHTEAVESLNNILPNKFQGRGMIDMAIAGLWSSIPASS